MAFVLDTYMPFDGFFVVIGKASPGDVRIFHFAEEVTPERMTPRMLFCDEFDYLGTRVPPGTTTQELPARLQGDWPMSPVRQDRDSYYFNSFRATWNGEYCDQPAVETKKVALLAGESYGVEHAAAVMLASGTVVVHRDNKQTTVTAPMIIDARCGSVIIDATTDATLCEVWI